MLMIIITRAIVAAIPEDTDRIAQKLAISRIFGKNYLTPLSQILILYY
jgi:hypothetical protein